MANGERIVWIDCEMTGLDLINDALIEVAAVVTDANLTVLGTPIDVVIKPSSQALVGMNDFVREMHTSSGLLEELPGGMSMSDAENHVMTYLREWVPVAAKAPLAGNSIGMDRAFLTRDMPTLAGHVHYRSIDVSSIKELARRWFPRVYFNAPAKTGNHRALGDILDSIDELRYYRAALFVADPGPTTAEAQQLAAMITASRSA